MTSALPSSSVYICGPVSTEWFTIIPSLNDLNN